MNRTRPRSVRRIVTQSGLPVLSWRLGCVRSLHAILALTSVLLLNPVRASAQAAGIDGVAPAAARHGETVTINGRGFGGQNVRITVAGLGPPW